MRDRLILTLFLLGLLVIAACEEPDEIPVNDTSDATSPTPITTTEPLITPEPPILNTPPSTTQQAPTSPPEPTPAPEPTPIAEPTPVLTPQPTPTITPEPAPAPKPTPSSTDNPIAPTPAEKVFIAQMPEDLKELLALPEKKVKSYEFVYAPPPDNLARDQYFIKGDKFRVQLYQANAFNINDYYDTVFVDTTKKTATGYCEGVRAGRCFNSTKPYTLKYTDWTKIKTPYQWLREIPYGEIEGSETIYDRKSVKVYFEKDNINWHYWLDEYSGLPLRIIQEKNDEETKYEFRYLALNTVTDDFVVHVE